MATNNDLVVAFRNAAEALLKREITQTELNQLIEEFNKAQGTHEERALSALTECVNFSKQLVEKTAASDNTDRIVQDLKDTIKNWKPGT